MRKTKYIVKPTRQFRKDYKLALKRHLDVKEDVIELLAMGRALPEEYQDHDLFGNWAGHRACRVLPDWHLIYSVEDSVLTLARTGTHSDIFGK